MHSADRRLQLFPFARFHRHPAARPQEIPGNLLRESPATVTVVYGGRGAPICLPVLYVCIYIYIYKHIYFTRTFPRPAGGRTFIIIYTVCVYYTRPRRNNIIIIVW